MALSQHIGSEIVGVVNLAPSKVEDNLELSMLSSAESQALVNHTGIRFRRSADKNQTIKELFQKSVDILLQKTAWEKETIDVLICVTQAPSQLIPSVSNCLHGDLKLPAHTIAFDINSGCSGFVYGLNVVQSLLSTMIGGNKRAILCCGDLSTHLIDENDTSVRPIFSDGVAAIAIEKKEDARDVTAYFNLETMGEGQHAIEMLPDEKMKLNGIDVFGYSVKYVPQNISKLMNFAQKDIQFPDAVVLHQANQLINESIRKKLQIEVGKLPYSLNEYGNMASASIPFTLALHADKLKQESGWILLSGFGVGFSVASALIRYRPAFSIIVLEK